MRLRVIQHFSIPTRSDTNLAVQVQTRAIRLKFQISIEGTPYYIGSENKGAGQL